MRAAQAIGGGSLDKYRVHFKDQSEEADQSGPRLAKDSEAELSRKAKKAAAARLGVHIPGISESLEPKCIAPPLSPGEKPRRNGPIIETEPLGNSNQ